MTNLRRRRARPSRVADASSWSVRRARLGVPVVATASFWVEGTLPWFFLGLLVGVAVLQGALGALIGLAVGYGIARLATRPRAAGAAFSTILAATATELLAVKGSFWTGRPLGDRRIGSWPLDNIDVEVRRKRLTTAVSVGLSDGRRMRLEIIHTRRSDALIARLPDASG